jgi:hypothetical protein
MFTRPKDPPKRRRFPHSRKTVLEVLALLVVNGGDSASTVLQWNQSEDKRIEEHAAHHPGRADLIPRHVSQDTVERWRDVKYPQEYARLTDQFYVDCKPMIRATWYRLMAVSKAKAHSLNSLQAAMAWSIFDKHMSLAEGRPTERHEVNESTIESRIKAIEKERGLSPKGDSDADTPEDGLENAPADDSDDPTKEEAGAHAADAPIGLVDDATPDQSTAENDDGDGRPGDDPAPGE